MTVDRALRVGVIGQDGRGRRLADVLAAAGHAVAFVEIDGQFTDRGADHGEVRRAVAAVGGADVLVTSIAREDSLLAVMRAVATMAPSGPTPTALLDLSPVLPETLREIDILLQPAAVAVFGAAVMPSRPHATGTMFIDGDLALPPGLSSIAAALAARVVRCGALGSSKVLTIIDRVLVGVNTVAAAEAIALARRAGLPADVIVPLVRKGSGASAALLRAYADTAAADDDAAQAGGPAFTVDDMRAMLGRALRLAQDRDHSLLFAALSQNAYRAASGLGLGGRDFAAGIRRAQKAFDDAPVLQHAAG